jgi:hypothetical protein
MEDAKRKCIDALQKFTDTKSDQLFGKTVPFTVDWEFMQSAEFKQMSDGDKTNCINALYNSHWNNLFGDSGFGNYVKNDKTGLFAAYIATVCCTFHFDFICIRYLLTRLIGIAFFSYSFFLLE